MWRLSWRASASWRAICGRSRTRVGKEVSLPRYSIWRPPIMQRCYSTGVGSRVGKGGPVTWVTLGVMLLAGGGAVMFVRQQVKENDAKRAKERSRSAGKADLGGPFHLTDHHGNERTNKDYIGKWLMIYFGFTFCPDICPDELEKLGVVLENLDKMKDQDISQLETVFISVDPDRDTPEVMKNYLKDFHPRILGLTGSHDQLHDVTKAFRVYHSPSPKDDDGDYLVDHTIIMYLIAPDGSFVNYYGQNRTADEIISNVVINMKKFQHKRTKK